MLSVLVVGFLDMLERGVVRPFRFVASTARLEDFVDWKELHRMDVSFTVKTDRRCRVC